MTLEGARTRLVNGPQPLGFAGCQAMRQSPDDGRRGAREECSWSQLHRRSGSFGAPVPRAHRLLTPPAAAPDSSLFQRDGWQADQVCRWGDSRRGASPVVFGSRAQESSRRCCANTHVKGVSLADAASFVRAHAALEVLRDVPQFPVPGKLGEGSLRGPLDGPWLASEPFVRAMRPVSVSAAASFPPVGSHAFDPARWALNKYATA